jgi:hypothetical protein
VNREQIIAMAREAGLGTALCHNSVEGERVWIEGADWHDELERFAALVAAAERASCANVCEAKGMVKGGEVFAARIRARGEK